MGVDAILILYRDGKEPVTYSPGRAYAFDGFDDSAIPSLKMDPHELIWRLDKLRPWFPESDDRENAKRIVEIWSKVYPGCLVQLTSESEIERSPALWDYEEWEDSSYVLPLDCAKPGRTP